MSFIIRNIQPTDNKKLAEIIRAVLTEFKANKPGTVYFDPTTDNLYELFQTKNAAYFVAEYNGELLGGSGIYPTENLPDGCTELVKLYLTAEARGKGIGNALIEKSCEAAMTFGYKKIYLESLPELKTAVGLYEKKGFRYLKAPMGNSGHFGCNIWMVKEL